MKILFVANVIKEHILKFHLPTIKAFSENKWIVDVIANGNEIVPYANRTINAKWKRNPFKFISFLKGCLQLKRIICDEQYDVVFCHTPVGGLAARMISKTIKKNKGIIIYCAHGFHFYKGAPLLNWLIYYPIEKYLSKRTDYIFTVNDEDYNLAKNKFKKCKIVNVPEVGVDFKRLLNINREVIRTKYRNELNLKDNDIVLIYVAELIKNKNQSMLIRTLAEVRKQKPNCYLLLVGPDHINGKYRKIAKKLNQQDNVIFLGWRSDVGELMATSDICVASSIREGFGINIVEAMFMSIPVVATNNRGHRSIIQDNVNGFLVDINDYKNMANCVLKLIENNNLYRQIILNNDLNKYDANLIGVQLYEYINNIIQKK